MPVPDSLAFASLAELGAGWRNGQWTALELAEFFLERCTRLGPRYNAVVTLTAERARAEALAADRDLKAGVDRGPLHGLPYGVKDLLATRGDPTTWGAAPYRDQVFDYDATVVEKLRAAGAVLIAKLSMVELAGGMGYQQPHAAFNGPGLNPWDATRWSGGSSSGPGSAVAAGLVSFAIGSETWGSILTPCAYCGVSGLRPTYGRVSRHGAMALSWTMDKLGPMARSAEDCRLVFAAIAGADPLDDSSVAVEAPLITPRDGETYRLLKFTGMLDRAQPEVAANFHAALEVITQFATIDEVPYPGDLPINTVADVIISAEAATAFRSLVVSGEIENLTAEEDRWRIWPDLMIPATDYIQALRIRRRVQTQLAELFSQYDAIVAPTLNTVAGPVDQFFAAWASGFSSTPLSGASNLAGLPAVGVPIGPGEAGMPTGLQFVGPAFSDERLLRLADAYQQRTDWHRRTPPLNQQP